MKSKTSIFIIAILTISALNLKAQDSCKVLMENLKGNYVGGCKNGLANGQGTATGVDTYVGNFKKGLPDGKGKYLWKTGEIYEGYWEKGLKQGNGNYTFKIDGHDTIVSGFWENDVFIGKKFKKPEIKNAYNIDSYDIRKGGSFEKRVLIDFQQNGMRNSEVSNISLISNNGNQTQSGQLIGFEAITFPITIVVRYSTYNKFHTVQFNAYIEFTIFEEGDWIVRLTN